MGRNVNGLRIQLTENKDNKKAILVVVDKLSKRAHFIALPGEHKAEDTARVFFMQKYTSTMAYLESVSI